MRQYPVDIEEATIPLSRFDIVIEWLLIGLLGFMPLAFGVVHAWSEEVVITVSGAIVICYLLKLVFNRGQEVVWSWAYVPGSLSSLEPHVRRSQALSVCT